MERLTEYIEDENGILGTSIIDTQRLTCGEFCKKPHNCKECPIGYAIDKLAAYEDAEEQGLLPRLPCKVGSTVYRINKDVRNPIIPLVVTEVRFKALKSGQVVIKIMCSDDVMTRTDGCSVYYEEEIGNKIFLTRETAEAALKAMQEGE